MEEKLYLDRKDVDKQSKSSPLKKIAIGLGVLVGISLFCLLLVLFGSTFIVSLFIIVPLSYILIIVPLGVYFIIKKGGIKFKPTNYNQSTQASGTHPFSIFHDNDY